MRHVAEMNTDPRTLEGARNILTVKNKIKMQTSGPTAEGTEIRCLRKNNSGYYIPCLAYLGQATVGGKFYVDLWKDKSERVCVSLKAILWPGGGKWHSSENWPGEKYADSSSKLEAV